MNSTNREMEVKFIVRDLKNLENKLINAGATLLHQREFESNLRFDLPDRSLTERRQVLRLRQDHRARLTYKGAQDPLAATNLRTEIEVGVDDYDNMKALLEVLGYFVVSKYEKYRTTYQLGDTEIVLDELPLGSFIELEGSAEDEIFKLASDLSLNWDSRVRQSYLELFDQFIAASGFFARYLDFSSFRETELTAADLGLSYAD